MGFMELRAIGERIRTLRKRRDLTQESLAAKAKVAHRALQRLEGGEGNPTLETLNALAVALKVPLSDLLGYLGQSQSAGTLANRQVDPETLKAAVHVLVAMTEASELRRLTAMYILTNDETYIDQLRTLGLPAQAAQALSKMP